MKQKFAELSAQADITNSEIRCESIIETLQLLLLDTEVFKGKPRTCDLYFLQHELTMSYYQYSAILVSLIESLPNEISPRLINASTKVLKTLLKQQVNLNGEDALLNKKCMKELVINIMSRFNILVEPRADSYSWKETCIKEFMLTAEAAGFDVSQKRYIIGSIKSMKRKNIGYHVLQIVENTRL